MKLLHYKNRFQLILDVIFKPTKFKLELEQIKREEIDNLVKDFTERIDLIGYDQYKNGIVINPSSKKISVIKLPIRGIDYSTFDNSHTVPSVSASIEHKDVYQFSVSYMSDKITTDEIKSICADLLAQKLIEEKFIQIQVNGNELICTVNAF